MKLQRRWEQGSFALRLGVKRILRRFGVDIVSARRSHVPALSRMRLIERHHVTLLLDVGANQGQYALEMRKLGYRNRIVSFEPLPEVFTRLERCAAADPAWRVVNVALGERDGDGELHVSGDTAGGSSSLLEMLPRHIEAAPETRTVGTQRVAIRRLDSIFGEHCGEGERAFLKLDAQGYEGRILDGAANALEKIVGLQIELSLVPLYRGSPLLPELVTRMAALGFTLMSIEPVMTDPASGQLLQVDGIFFRDRAN